MEKIIAHKHQSFFKFSLLFSTAFAILSFAAVIVSYLTTWGAYQDSLRIYNDPEIAALRQNIIDTYGPAWADPPPEPPVTAHIIAMTCSLVCLIIFSTIIIRTLYIDKTNPEAMIYKNGDCYYVYNRKIKKYIEIPESRLISMNQSKDDGYMNVTTRTGPYTVEYRVEKTHNICGYMTVKYYDENNKKCRITVQSYTGPLKNGHTYSE